MTEVYPEGVSTLGNTKHTWVAAIADPEAPKLTELTAVAPASLGISCALYGESTFMVTQSVSRSAVKRRSCERDTYERTTSVTRSVADIAYAISPQAAAGSDGKKVFETLTEGKVGYVVERFGLDARSEDLAVGDFVNVYPVTLGPALIAAQPDESGEYQVTQSIDLRGKPVQNVAIVS